MSDDLDRMRNGWRPMDSCPPGPVLVWETGDVIVTAFGAAPPAKAVA